MKIASLIARYVLGLGFAFFGSNGLFHFLHEPPIPPSDAADFIHALVHSHFIVPIAAVEVVCGLLLLVNRFVPLALTFLAAILLNAFFFHAFMAPSGMPMLLVFVLLWVLAAIPVWPAFTPLFQSHPNANRN